MRRQLATAAAITVLVVGLAACSSKSSESDGNGGTGRSSTSSVPKGGASGPTITASGFAFSPKVVNVGADTTTITVRNADSVGHNLTIEDLDVNVALPGGRTTSVPVTLTSGSHAFFCSIHPTSMRGTITVP